MPAPVGLDGALEGKPPQHEEHKRRLREALAHHESGIDMYSPDVEDIARMRRHYYAKTTTVDEQLGKVLDALETAGIHRRVVVVGYGAEQVEAALSGIEGVSFALQEQQRGTGDAVAAASQAIAQAVNEAGGARVPVLIVTGDSPMLQPASIQRLLTAFAEQPTACLLGTAMTEDPDGLGRVVRDESGRFQRIVEHRQNGAGNHSRLPRSLRGTTPAPHRR